MPRFAWFIVLILLLSGCGNPAPETEQFQVAEALGGASDAGFARATNPREFLFPQDHGPHPEFRNEWWYLTGNLHAEDGRDFAYQATLFRIALQPEPIDSPSAWRSNQIWMGHAALSDLQAGKHTAFERFARQGAGLAGAESLPLRVWLEDWQLQQAGGTGVWKLQIPTEEFDLRLELKPASPIILQGDNGLSQKSRTPGNASYYYSIPRLTANGALSYRGETLRVNGQSWLDREWSTSALGPDQQGWDWFSLQLNDGRNLMFYQLRRKDGSVDPLSAGSLSDERGLRQHLRPEMIRLTPLKYWVSGNRRYPIEWRLELEGEPHPWRVSTRLADQEMRLSVTYWEGAVEVRQESSGDLLGKGYLEMTGYD
ncbi:MAG: lipocalin-like domain-containing protein [Pseudomonadota bacterium]